MTYIEVDVESGPNSSWAVVKIFQATDVAKEITWVSTMRPDGSVGGCLVTGWSDAGPAPAYAATVSDSGEGLVLLIYGGTHGVRLKKEDSLEPWDLSDSEQWGEPCLLLAVDTRFA